MNDQTPICPQPFLFSIDPEQLETAVRALLDAQRYFMRAATAFDTLRATVKVTSIDCGDEAIMTTLELSARAFSSIAEQEGETLYQLAQALDAGKNPESSGKAAAWRAMAT